MELKIDNLEINFFYILASSEKSTIFAPPLKKDVSLERWQSDRLQRS